MLGTWMLLTVFAAQPETDVEFVVAQLFAQNRSIKTVTAKFQTRSWMLPNLEADDSEADFTAWQGTVTAAPPDKWHVTFRTIDPADFDKPISAGNVVEDSEETSGFILNQGKLTDFQTLPNGVPFASVQNDLSGRLNSDPCIGLFFDMAILHSLEDQQLDGWTVKATQDGLLEVSGKPAEREVPVWTLDPGKGFAMVKSSREFNPPPEYSHYAAQSDATFNRIEAASGIWMTESGVREQVMNGRKNWKVEFRLIPGSLKVNEPIPKEAFEPVFKDGTQVVDQLTKRSYAIGGRAALERHLSDSASASESAAGNQSTPRGAITAIAPFWERNFWPTLFALSITVLIAVGLLRWRNSRTMT